MYRGSPCENGLLLSTLRTSHIAIPHLQAVVKVLHLCGMWFFSSFSRERTFLSGSSWFKGSYDFALSRTHRGWRPILLLMPLRGAAYFLHFKIFAIRLIIVQIKVSSLWFQQIFGSNKNDTSDLSQKFEIFFSSSTTKILISYVLIFFISAKSVLLKH